MSDSEAGKGQKFYIGDAVHGIWHSWGMLTLTTEDGPIEKRVTNVIHLEPEVIDVLLKCIAARAAECKAGNKEKES